MFGCGEYGFGDGDFDSEPPMEDTKLAGRYTFGGGPGGGGGQCCGLYERSRFGEGGANWKCGASALVEVGGKWNSLSLEMEDVGERSGGLLHAQIPKTLSNFS